MYDNDDFPDWKNRKLSDLLLMYVEKDEKTQTEFEDFCWGEFEAEQQAYADYLYDQMKDGD